MLAIIKSNAGIRPGLAMTLSTVHLWSMSNVGERRRPNDRPALELNILLERCATTPSYVQR